MFKRLFILLFGLVGFINLSAQAQQSAQASMRVTVKVVKGSKMQLSKPDKISVKENKSSVLGQLTLDARGGQSTRVRTNPKITLLSANGAQMDMNINTMWKERDGKRHLLLSGLTHSQQLRSGDYKGELKTTLEYN